MKDKIASLKSQAGSANDMDEYSKSALINDLGTVLENVNSLSEYIVGSLNSVAELEEESVQSIQSENQQRG